MVAGKTLQTGLKMNGCWFIFYFVKTGEASVNISEQGILSRLPAPISTEPVGSPVRHRSGKYLMSTLQC